MKVRFLVLPAILLLIFVSLLAYGKGPMPVECREQVESAGMPPDADWEWSAIDGQCAFWWTK